jgi:hypothetical protein
LQYFDIDKMRGDSERLSAFAPVFLGRAFEIAEMLVLRNIQP